MTETRPKHVRLSILLVVAFVLGGIVLFGNDGKEPKGNVDPLMEISGKHPKNEGQVDACVASLRERVKTAEGKDMDLSRHFPMSANAVLSYVDEDGKAHTMGMDELRETHDLRKMENLQDLIQQGHKMLAMKNDVYFLYGSNVVITGDATTCQITGVFGPEPDGDYHRAVASKIHGNVHVAVDSRKYVKPVGEPCISPYFALYMAGTVYQSKPKDYVKKYLRREGLVYLGDRRHRHWRVVGFRQPKTRRIFFVFRGVNSFYSGLQAFFGATRSTLRVFDRWVNHQLRRNRRYRAYACIGHSRGGWFANRVRVPYKVWRITFNGHKCHSGKFNINVRCKGDVVSANSNQYMTLRCRGHGLTAFKSKMRYKSWRSWHRRVHRDIRRSRRCIRRPR